eukprot:3329143-Alexandrium_andersonii.AAC.1
MASGGRGAGAVGRRRAQPPWRKAPRSSGLPRGARLAPDRGLGGRDMDGSGTGVAKVSLL